MTEPQAEAPDTRTNARRRVFHRTIAIGIAVLAMPVLLFFAASALVNRTRIPAELEQLPPDLAARLAPDAPDATDDSAPLTADPQRELASPVARRTRADDVPTTTSQDGSAPYNAFLEAELRERPELEGARLYLELSRQVPTTKIWEELRQFWKERGREDSSPFNEPPTREEVEWLASHTDAALFLPFAESTGLPQRSRAAILGDSDPMHVPGPNVILLRLGSRILGAEAQRRMEAGDPAGAERFWQAAVRIAVQQGREPLSAAGLFCAVALNQSLPSLADWVASGNAPPEVLADLRPALAEAHRAVFGREWMLDEQERMYPVMRQGLVEQCNRDSWRSELFGWDVHYPSEGMYHQYVFNFHGVAVPRVDNMALTAVHAMLNKSRAPRFLRECDDMQREAIRHARMTWPERAASGAWPWPRDNPFLGSSYGNQMFGKPPAYAGLDRVFPAEARLNLLRAAIEWRLAPPDAKPDPATMTITDRESPWRDPFAEAPLRMTALAPGGDETGGVLLYSLGSDLQDQHGQIEYDPSNGTVSAGDLTLKMDVKR